MTARLDAIFFTEPTTQFEESTVPDLRSAINAAVSEPTLVSSDPATEPPAHEPPAASRNHADPTEIMPVQQEASSAHDLCPTSMTKSDEHDPCLPSTTKFNEHDLKTVYRKQLTFFLIVSISELLSIRA